jgi:hypothetical protein
MDGVFRDSGAVELCDLANRLPQLTAAGSPEDIGDFYAEWNALRLRTPDDSEVRTSESSARRAFHTALRAYPFVGTRLGDDLDVWSRNQRRVTLKDFVDQAKIVFNNLIEDEYEKSMRTGRPPFQAVTRRRLANDTCKMRHSSGTTPHSFRECKMAARLVQQGAIQQLLQRLRDDAPEPTPAEVRALNTLDLGGGGAQRGGGGALQQRAEALAALATVNLQPAGYGTGGGRGAGRSGGRGGGGGGRGETGGSSDDSMVCRRCGERGHRAANCDKQEQRACYNCNELGHLSRDCPKAPTDKTKQARANAVSPVAAVAEEQQRTVHWGEDEEWDEQSDSPVEVAAAASVPRLAGRPLAGTTTGCSRGSGAGRRGRDEHRLGRLHGEVVPRPRRVLPAGVRER